MAALNKQTVWKSIKQSVISQMQKNEITPKRADHILGYVKITLNSVTNMEELGRYCGILQEKFSELESAINQLRLKEEEKMEQIISKVTTQVMEEGDFEHAGQLMTKLEKIRDIEEKTQIIQKFSPDTFEKEYKKIFIDENTKK